MGVLVFLGLEISLEGCFSVSYYKSSDFLWVGITWTRDGIGTGGTYVLTGAMTLDSSYLNINIKLQHKCSTHQINPNPWSLESCPR